MTDLAATPVLDNTASIPIIRPTKRFGLIKVSRDPQAMSPAPIPASPATYYLSKIRFDPADVAGLVAASITGTIALSLAALAGWIILNGAY